MKIGLIDVDGHSFPNIALMRISAYHKARGDTVEWWWSDFFHYDIVYMSKIFSNSYTEDVPEPFNADRVIKGGTGYCIYIGEDGKEHFDKSKNTELPPEIERCFPDYSLYPHYILNPKREVRYIRGRLKFGKAKNNAPFPSMIVIFKPNRKDDESEHDAGRSS